MASTRERYINFFTDFAFKRLFGSEPCKDLLLDFLNALLHKDTGRIESISYMKNEQVGRAEYDRRAIYDIYCNNEKGESFIVEIQKTKQKYFKDRALYYATFPISAQAVKGDWDFKLVPVYVVAILDFIFDDDAGGDKYRYNVSLLDEETHKRFYDKLKFVYLELPKFKKEESELQSHFEKWLYAIKNLSRLDRVPARLQEQVFEKFFEEAEIARFTPEEHLGYEDSLKAYRDLKNSIDTARGEGLAQGLEQGREEGLAQGREEGLAQGLARGKEESAFEIAQKMLQSGLPVEMILNCTNLTTAQIELLRRKAGQS